MTMEIPLTKGKIAIIDKKDFEKVKDYNWYCSTIGYAVAKIPGGATIRMHRLIVDALPNVGIDHINTNKLDNRRENLRSASAQQNSFNRGRNKNNKSGYKNVCYHKQAQKWRAYIVKNNKQISLGLYNTPEEAFEAYCKVASLYHGDFANTGV